VQHTDYFGNFLTNTVNLSQFKLDVLEGRVDAIYRTLRHGPVMITW